MNTRMFLRGKTWRWAALLLLAVAVIGIADTKVQAGEETGLLIDLGNEKCPVMGREVDGTTYSEWRGLRIGHCCGCCTGTLLADPKTYLDKTGINWRQARKAVDKVNAASGSEQAKLLAKLGQTFTVIRAPAPAPDSDSATTKRYVADLGNAKCPIMGGEVDGETFSVWNGVRVGHCCGGCTSKFLNDPAKHLAKAGIEWQGTAKAVAELNATQSGAQQKKAKTLESRYTLSEIGSGLQIDLGNAKCPIMRGRAVNGRTFTIWNGLRVGHCCPGCSKRLLADPEKALDGAGIEWRQAAKAVAMVDSATGEEKQKLIRAAKRDFKVLSAPGDE
jgi:hypothetical protein